MKIELPRTSSCNSASTNKIISTNYTRSTSLNHQSNNSHPNLIITNKSIVHKKSLTSFTLHRGGVSALFRSLLTLISLPNILPTRLRLALPSPTRSIRTSLGRKVTGTLFGNRRGHVSFAVQDDPRSAPALLIELPISTSSLVKEMSTGLVRIALECKKGQARGRHGKLINEPTWTMYCNGRKSGHALSRACDESDWHVLSTVQSMSVGAGVIPVVDEVGKDCESEGELLYMRARFERVVGTHHSEAYYMMNPDGNGGPELTIFLLRV